MWDLMPFLVRKMCSLSIEMEEKCVMLYPDPQEGVTTLETKRNAGVDKMEGQ